MMERKQRNSLGVPFFCIWALVFFTGILIIPSTRDMFGELSLAHPFLMGFVKFFFLATVGELIAARLTNKYWVVPKYIAARAVIWGFLGMLITLAFKIFGTGVEGILEAEILAGGTGAVWKAFMTSLWCNLFFAPFMMGLHKLTDTYLNLKGQGASDITLATVAKTVNWQLFITFTLGKTIPIFWIPAHTISFLLPPQYQIIMAAYLSIALGIILSFKKK